MYGTAWTDPPVSPMEDYLLECLEFLQRAGNDVGRRRKEVQTPQVWTLLPFEWKALAILAATKAAPAAIDIESASRPGSAVSSHRQRRGRRHGRGRVTKIEDRLASSVEALSSSETAAYKLAVLTVQRERMGTSWDSSWDSEMDSLRVECEQGVHPV